jgi:hypothetical protein
MPVIIVRLPDNRDRAGQLLLEDSGGRPIAGPFPVCGRADGRMAGSHNNPDRNPLLPFGDMPLGEYQAVQILGTGAGTEFPLDEFGSAGVVFLQPKEGPAALAEANGRFGFFIQGGLRSRNGLLRPTEDGSLRLMDRDQRKLIMALRQLGQVNHRCVILAASKAGGRVAVVTVSKQSASRRKSAASVLLASSVAASAIMGTVRQALYRAALHAGVSATVAVPGVLLFTAGHASAQGQGADYTPTAPSTPQPATDTGNNTPHLTGSLPGIYLNDDTGNGNDTPYGIQGLPGVNVNGPRTDADATSPSDTQLPAMNGDANPEPAQPANPEPNGGNTPDASSTPPAQPAAIPEPQYSTEPAPAVTPPTLSPGQTPAEDLHDAPNSPQAQPGTMTPQPIAPAPLPNAMDDLNTVQQNSQDATHAVTDEQAHQQAGNGFDTPSSIAPAVDLSGKQGVVSPDAASGGMPSAAAAGMASGSPISSDTQASVADHAQQAISEFVAENPDIKDNPPQLTAGGGNRTVDEQEQIILNPKFAGQYPTQERFKKQFNLDSLPAYDSLTDEQKQWLDSAVNSQAGKSPGFAHVGGYAQDVSVKNLTLDQKSALLSKLAQGGYGVLNETYADPTTGKAKFNVDINDATVFHVYKKQ